MQNKTDYDLRQLQLAQLKVLDELKRVCKKHGIRFYLAYGSCLGALRHKGFIPWDDDIDVLMPVEDYDRLMECAGEFGEEFFLQNTDTDSDYHLAIARLRLNGTACVEESDLSETCHQGIFVDIYPQYFYPSTLFGRMRAAYSSVCYRILLLNRPPKNHGKVIYGIGKLMLAALSVGGREKKIEHYRNILRRPKNTAHVADYYGMDMTLKELITYRASWFKKPRWVEFEGRKMPVPTGAEQFMAARYGTDFMELPPEDKRKSYHKYAYVDFEGEYSPE